MTTAVTVPRKQLGNAAAAASPTVAATELKMHRATAVLAAAPMGGTRLGILVGSGGLADGSSARTTPRWEDVVAVMSIIILIVLIMMVSFGFLTAETLQLAGIQDGRIGRIECHVDVAVAVVIVG
mmetsp:Transcript_8322/g.15436  ORF Transcript_8322/g.15436 Transcript_8322/m.15436 type:complete len:125 (-) Transcript_8322:20-394(-)